MGELDVAQVGPILSLFFLSVFVVAVVLLGSGWTCIITWGPMLGWCTLTRCCAAYCSHELEHGWADLDLSGAFSCRFVLVLARQPQFISPWFTGSYMLLVSVGASSRFGESSYLNKPLFIVPFRSVEHSIMQEALPCMKTISHTSS